MKIKFLALIVVVAIGAVWAIVHADNKPAPKTKNHAVMVNYCAGNAAEQKVIVSIAKQHMWACQNSKTVYSNAVVTGMQKYPADLTPLGTYKIYDKLTDQDLKGSDSTGSWDDPVHYWLPFLQNQYGIYGFHDATWRVNSDFGKVNINAPSTAVQHGSHGCVELPLAAAKWLYGWAGVGTTIVIES